MADHAFGTSIERFLDLKYNPQTRTWYANYLRPLVDFLGAERSVHLV